MKNILNTIKTSQILLLFLLPAFYLFTGAYFRTLLGDLSLRSVDPDYVYFSNGLGVSIGSFNTGNIFHPGSPLQYFVAIVFRLVYLLRSPAVPYLEDVFANPDLYMSVVSLCITGLISLLLLAAGYLVQRTTKSTLYGLLVQTSVFVPIIWYDLNGRVTQEVFQAFSALALMVVVIYYYRNNKPANTTASMLLFAFIMAFGLSTKVTFVPLMLIPLFIIENWKKKVLFSALTILIFLAISISVLFQIGVFWDWMKNIFLHSGDYGAGSTDVIDFNLFKTNLTDFVRLESWYFKIIFVSFLSLLLYLGIYRKKADRRLVLYSSSVILAILVQLIIVSKHFAHRNFVPSLLLLPLVVFFTLEILKKLSANKIYTLSLQLVLAAFLLMTVRNQFLWLPIKSDAMESDIRARKETQRYTAVFDPNSIKIITSQSYGCPFKEYALMYSTAWSANKLKPKYAEVLGKLYPFTYQHTTWDDRFQYWGEKFDAQKIIDSGKSVYLYIERNDEELYNRTLTRIQKESESGFTAERVLIFSNPANSETLYQLKLTKVEKTDSIKGSAKKTVPVSIAN